MVVKVYQLGAAGWLYVKDSGRPDGTDTTGLDGIVVYHPASNSADCVASVKLMPVAVKSLKV